jgi:hypothetical protein
MTEEFHIGLPNPDQYRKKYKGFSSYDNIIPYRQWRILPDYACFTGQSIFCDDTLVGTTFITK